MQRPFRPLDDRILAGVCLALAERYDMSVLMIRLLFIVATFAYGIGAVVYCGLWILIPGEGGEEGHLVISRLTRRLTSRARDTYLTSRLWIREASRTHFSGLERRAPSPRTMLAILCLALGLFILLFTLGIFSILSPTKIFALVLVILGLAILLGNGSHRDRGGP